MPTVHILTQYIWPDAAPTGLYAEHLATRLHKLGCDVRLVGGNGNYRTMQRDKPPVPILNLEHYGGHRGNLGQTFIEYASVKRAFERYIDNIVKPDDAVIVTSAPPNSVQLATCIKRRGARAVYWLQDYYPELIRGVHEYPAALRLAFSKWWDNQLLQWDRVIKIGANLGGPMNNSVVIRNWPTMSFEASIAAEPGTAIYSGNLGYGHDVELFVAACEKLRNEGYRISIHADGRGLQRLPSWLTPKPLESNPVKLRDNLLRHEVHLIAANPRITRAIFPSKIWNSFATGRRLICTGFEGEMADELKASRNAPFTRHLDQWLELLSDMIEPRAWNPMQVAA